MQEEEAAFLPGPVIRQIAARLVQGESPGNAVLYLLAMSGVCKHWRTFASEVSEDTRLAFDGLDNPMMIPGQSILTKFRKLSSAAKAQVYAGAAKLLRGEPREIARTLQQALHIFNEAILV